MTVVVSANNITFSSGGTAAAPIITPSTDTNTGMFFPAADTIAFAEGGAESMRIDSSGNVGLGVTPSAWSTANSIKALQTPSGALWNFSTNYLYLGQNYYWNGSNRIYINTDGASEYQQNAGTHIWFTAPSGTAGTTATFTERMRIGSSGNVGIGVTNPTIKLDVEGRGRFLQDAAATSGSIVLRQNSGNTVGGYIQWVTNDSATEKGWLNVDTSSNMIFATVSTERMRIDSSGRVLIGVSSVPPDAANANGKVFVPSEGACVLRSYTNDTGVTVHHYFFNPNGLCGSITTTASATAYNTSSDYRLKENIAPMTGALDTVAQLKPCTYTWKVDGEAGQGFIAHELQEVVPQAVSGEKDAVNKDGTIKPQGVDTSFLVATLTAAIQELKAELDSVKAELQTLKGA